MTERMHFVSLCAEGLYSMTELCARFGISRKTGYKWLARFGAEGPAGLEEQSRAPKHCPQRLSEEVAAALLEAKRRHPTWGPRKLRPWLARRRPELALPAPSTIGALLARHGLTRPRRRRRRPVHPGGAPLGRAATPNECWSADYKGQFATGDGIDCYPLTVADAYSRYLLGCEARLSTKQSGARALFERLFREYGLPRAIRTDNGTPFATTAIRGLSRLSVWWIQLGIRHERIEPGRPEQNGAHERMHRTLGAETARPPARDRHAQQARFDRFRAEYNAERPHEALAHQTPAAVYRPSERALPERLPAPEYPGHYQLRRVRHKGAIRFQGQPRFLSETLRGHTIGLEEIDDGLWSIYFYDVLLARFDERDGKVHG